MKIKHIYKLLFVSILVMILFPFAAVNFIKSDASMVICFILFFIVNPITSIYIGISSIKVNGWLMPVLLSLLFIIGTWVFFDYKEIVFIYYGLIYLLIGYASMFLILLLKRAHINHI